MAEVKKKYTTFWQWSQIIPPILARLLAKKGPWQMMNDREIAARSGLSMADIWWLSNCTSWDRVDMPTMRKFLVGCGVDFCNWGDMQKIHKYLFDKRAKPAFKHLRAQAQWKSHYLPLYIRWRKTLPADS